MMVLGVDPGFTGALAWYYPTTQRLIRVVPMPLVKAGATVFTSDSVKRQIDNPTLARMMAATPLTFAVVERVDSSPQMGVSSAFRFGQTFGVLQGVLAALNVPVKYAYPAAWKAGMNLSKNKNDSLVLACRLFPEWATVFKKDGKSADLAEAALLAKFGERFLPVTQK